MKILTVCEHGNVRSVALAYLLKVIYGYDVLAIGMKETGIETQNMLFTWADTIIFLEHSFVPSTWSQEQLSKVKVLDVI